MFKKSTKLLKCKGRVTNSSFFLSAQLSRVEWRYLPEAKSSQKILSYHTTTDIAKQTPSFCSLGLIIILGSALLYYHHRKDHFSNFDETMLPVETPKTKFSCQFVNECHARNIWKNCVENKSSAKSA